MDLISLSAANAKSPYKIDSEPSGSFFFVTDKQRPYHVAFIEDPLFYEHGICQYCLDTDVHAEADSHVYEVVVALMEEFSSRVRKDFCMSAIPWTGDRQHATAFSTVGSTPTSIGTNTFCFSAKCLTRVYCNTFR